jgi:lipid II:glycine glycyltransferase (peptidoglycan interpeptide bridge formation enzyme)
MKDINATVIVDLTLSEDEIFNNLQKDARWGIKKAQKEGLVVEESVEWETFYDIYTVEMKWRGINPMELEKMKELTSVFFVCKKEGKVIAGAGIWFSDIYNKEIPRLFFNASLSDFMSLQPNNLLYWSCILWCKRKGYKEFDLGGWQINAKGNLEGVNKFKERWGKVVYFDKEYSIHKSVGRKLVRNFKFFNWLNKKLKGIK